MKRLASEIRKNGFNYTQILRGEKYALYVQMQGVTIAGHEVFKIIEKGETDAFGRIFPACEEFPRNERFGIDAWSVGTEPTKAIAFYNQKEAEYSQGRLKAA